MDKRIIDFIYESGGIGVEFYNPAEYRENGTYYTITDSDDELFRVEWFDVNFQEWSHDRMGWSHFKNTLEDGFYVIKNMDFVLQAMASNIGVYTDDVFGDLNEAFNTHKPRLVLRFDPPIYNVSELKNILRVMEAVYPKVSWKSGNRLTDIPYSVTQVFEEEGDNEVIYYLSIGYYQPSPNGLVYTACYDGDPYLCDDDMERFGPPKDGWDWYRNHRYDADETTSILDDLNESEDDFGWAEELVDTPIKGPVPGQVYRVTVDDEDSINGIIDVLITKVELNSVYDNARAIVTNPTSVSPEEILEFIEDYNKNGGFTTKNHVEYLIESGHWVLISYDKSLFSIEDFDPHYYTDRGLDL